MAEKNDYHNMRDHDLLVQVATKQDMMHDDMKETFAELKKEDDILHSRISEANEQTDDKVVEVNQRVDRIRWFSVGSGGLGGLVGAFLAFLTGGKQ